MSTRRTSGWAMPWLGDPFPTFGLFGELRRAVEDFDRPAIGPRFSFEDRGESLHITGDLPGFVHEDLEVELEHDTLTLRGRRQTKALEGYAVHRRERGSMEIARAFTLPCRVDPTRAVATLKNGTFELTLPKASDEQARRIEVQIG